MDLSAGHIQKYAVPVDRTEGQKRTLPTPPQESVDWKRQRVEPNVTPAPAADPAPVDPRLLQPISQGSQPASASAIPSSNASPASTSAGAAADPPVANTTPGVATADLPVVEAMVRREGTDKFKRFAFDPTLNAEQRAERIQDEKKKICPKSAIDRVLAGLGASDGFQCDDSMAPSLCLLAEHMLEQTMEFGALMASRRKSKWLEAKDMELYLDRNWQIPLPAFGHRSISAVPKYNAESTDARYRAAVRHALSNLQPTEGQAKKADDKGASHEHVEAGAGDNSA
eukprot:jgi/Ulvmu1/7794/UM004_0023.1